MFRRSSVLATTIASAALSLGALTGTPAAAAAPTATTGSDDLKVKEYALSDTFSCDYYNLPWCR